MPNGGGGHRQMPLHLNMTYSLNIQQDFAGWSSDIQVILYFEDILFI